MAHFEALINNQLRTHIEFVDAFKKDSVAYSQFPTRTIHRVLALDQLN
jgi:hypothetical protein